MRRTDSSYPFQPDAPRWLALLLAALVGAGVGGIGVFTLKVTGL